MPQAKYICLSNTQAYIEGFIIHPILKIFKYSTKILSLSCTIEIKMIWIINLELYFK